MQKKMTAGLLIISMFVAMLVQPNRAYAMCTQSEAVNWANAQIGKGLDYDGWYGNQCVDLIAYYYRYLGTTTPGGNANAYAWNTLPSGWTRVYGGYQPGDIAVWKVNHSCSTCNTTSLGHVGIITSADSVGFNAVNQNYCDRSYCTSNWFYCSALQCAIRPNFSSQSLSYSDLKTTFVDTWNAGLHGQINNPSGIKVPTVGAYVWDAAGNLVVNHSEACNLSNTTITQELNIVGEALPSGLKQGQSYTYQLYAIANGQTFKSGVGSFVVVDNQKPILSNVKVSNITEDGYTVTCTATDNAGVAKVQFPTWTTNNGQDDIVSNWWENSSSAGTKSGTTYTYQVKRSAHNSEYGEYITHVYAYDAYGNYVCVPASTVTLKKTIVPTPTPTPAPISTPTPTPSTTLTPDSPLMVEPSVTPFQEQSLTTTTEVTQNKIKVTGLTVKNISKKKMRIYYKKAASATQYCVVYARNKGFTKSVKKLYTTKNIVMVKNLKKNVTYYVKVLALKGNVSGTYSVVKKVKIKK